jgi:hypothetical protein
MFFESTSTRFSFASALAWTVLAALFVVAPKAHGQDVSVTIPDTTAVTGDTVSVPVSLSGLDQASDVTAYGFELSFASDSLGYAGFETESTLSAQADFTVSDNPDVPRIGGFGATPLNDVADEGAILRMKFVVLAEGPTQVTLQSLQFNDGSPPASPSQPAFTISGTPPNFPPVGVDDSYETVTNQSLQVDSRSAGVLANDSDPNGDSLSASLGRSPSNGTVTFDSDGTFEYTPDSSFTGEDTFRYGVSDPEAAVDSATVTISVVPPNTPPTITEIDDQTIPEDSTTGPLSFTIGDEETDPSDLSVQATSTTQSLIPDDSISLDGTGENREVVVTPVPNGNGDATVTITVSDGRASTQQEFQVTVQAVNSAPTGKNDQYRVAADDTLQVSDPNRGVLANDSDAENDPLSSFVADGVSSGSLSLDSTGTFDYVPEAGFTGGDAFTYVVADGRGGRDTATAAITVQPTDSVVVTADSKEAAPGDTVEVPLMVDNLNQAASITSYNFFLQYDETAVGYGGFSTDSTLSEEADFTVEDNPESGQIGAFGGLPLDSIAAEGVLLRLQFVVLEEGTSTIALDSLQFNAGIPSAHPSEPQFSVTGDFPNRSPQLASDQYQVTEGDMLVVERARGVLANDLDPDGDSLTASLLAAPTDGSLTFQADGTFEYDPNPAFTGTDSFRYSASDPQGLQDSTSVEILVETDSTVAVDLEDTQGNLNDTLAVPIRLDRLGQVADITSYGFDLTFDSTKVAYAGFEADSTFSAQADFTVNDNPDIPRVGAFGATPLNEQGSQGVMLVLKFQPLVSGTTTIALDQLQFNQGTPASSPEAPSSTVTIGSADQPTAVADTFSTPKDSTLTVASPGVLENDSDPNGDSLSASLISDVSSGALSLGEDGSFEYVPDPEFEGIDQFTYEVSDGNGETDRATAKIEVGSVTTVSFDFSDKTVATGDTTTVDLSVSGFENVTSAQFTVSWDSTVASFSSVGNFNLRGLSSGDFGTPEAEEISSGTMTLVWSDPEATGATLEDGTVLFSMELVADGETSAVTPVSFGDDPTAREVTVDFESVTFEGSEGSLEVIDAVSISGNVSYYTSDSAPISGTLLQLDGEGASSTTSTATDGSFTFEDVEPGSYTLSPSNETSDPSRGISALDLVLMQRDILGLEPLGGPHQRLAADVNGSASITALDIVLTQRVILALSSSVPAGFWRFVPADHTFEDPTNPHSAPSSRNYTDLSESISGQGFVASKRGDVNGSWVESTSAGEAEPATISDAGADSKQSTRSMALQIEGRSASLGDTVRVPLRATQFRDIAAFQHTIQWNPERLTFLETEEYGLRGLGPQNMGTEHAPDGNLPVVWFDPEGEGQSLEEGEPVTVLSFRVEKPGQTDVRFAANPTPPRAYGGEGALTRKPFSGEKGVVQVEEGPQSFQLSANYPNPARRSTTVEYSLPQSEHVTLEIYDLLGRVVATPVDGTRRAGRHTARMDVGQLSSGIYIVRLQAGSFSGTQKMMVAQ